MLTLRHKKQHRFSSTPLEKNMLFNPPFSLPLQRITPFLACSSRLMLLLLKQLVTQLTVCLTIRLFLKNSNTTIITGEIPVKRRFC